MVTDSTDPQFKGGAWGWDLTQWRKLAMVWGYSGSMGEAVNDTDADVGNNTLETTVVPAGEVHVVHSAFAVNNNTDVGAIIFQVISGGTTHYLHRSTSPGVGNSVELPVMIILNPGDHMHCVFAGCADGDTIRFHIWGYKMEIAE